MFLVSNLSYKISSPAETKLVLIITPFSKYFSALLLNLQLSI
ncbi:putative ion transport [Listeria ivanovii FSL F6-596]|nr:putative ion transport [Listeria ivanovii FSL F6-596]